jgi:hypothetical protein
VFSARLVVAASTLAAILFLDGLPTPAADVRGAIDAFLRRVADVEIHDLAIRQDVTIYHPDGLRPSVRGEQRLLVKPPARQRLEQVIDGQREVRLVVHGRVWVRRADGKTHEAPPTERERAGAGPLVPSRRSADELLEEWRRLGVQAGLSHVERIGGRPITVIGALAGDRDTPAAWLDPEYGVVRFTTRERVGSGIALVDRTFSDHRLLIGAFRFPWRQETFVDGKLLVLVTVRAAAANSGLDDGLFDPGALARER